jgi:CRISP-associated protein Cas1
MIPVAKHVLCLTQGASAIRLRDGCIEVSGETPLQIPAAEVGAIVVDHPRVTVTRSAITAVVASGGSVIWTDSRHMPSAATFSLVGTATQTERIARQIALSVPSRKRIWQRIIQAKIAGQAFVLGQLTGSNQQLDRLVPKVLSGDRTGRESVAAKRYWQALMGTAFRRGSVSVPNAFLNYGYAVLRAEVGKRICAAGLHPGVPVHHHNRYDPMPLASDLMEVLRPAVDSLVVSHLKMASPAGLIRSDRIRLLKALLIDEVDGLGMNLPTAAAGVVAAYVAAVDNGLAHFIVPPWPQ